MKLERNNFQRLLFRTAFCLIACDGHIDEREISEIKLMNKSTTYFQGIDLSGELAQLLSQLKEKGKNVIDELFETLANIDISVVQELLLLEVAFRLIHADEKVDENEIKFLRFLRSKLKLHDQIIKDRFGIVEYLFDKDDSQNIEINELKSDLFSAIAAPHLENLELIDLSEGRVH